MLTIPGTAHYVKLALFTIFTQDTYYYSYGDPLSECSVRLKGYVEEVTGFMGSVKNSLSFDDLTTKYPDVVFRFAFQIHKRWGFNKGMFEADDYT